MVQSRDKHSPCPHGADGLLGVCSTWALMCDKPPQSCRSYDFTQFCA